MGLNLVHKIPRSSCLAIAARNTVDLSFVESGLRGFHPLRGVFERRQNEDAARLAARKMLGYTGANANRRL
jgi:hypothetical protein